MKQTIAVFFLLLLFAGWSNAAWFNTSYSYCRDITNVVAPEVEVIGATMIPLEPVNHGRGIFINSSAWANKPHENSITLVNASCGEGGSPVPFEIISNSTATNHLTNFTLFFFASLIPISNYSIYYDTANVGKPIYAGDLGVIESGGDYKFYTINTTFFTATVNRLGGLSNYSFLDFKYDNYVHYNPPTGLPTYYGELAYGDQIWFTTNYFAAFGNITCSYIYNGTLTKWMLCNTTQNDAKIEYHFYDSNNQQLQIVDERWTNASGRSGNALLELRDDISRGMMVNATGAFSLIPAYDPDEGPPAGVYPLDGGIAIFNSVDAPYDGKATLVFSYNMTASDSFPPITPNTFSSGNTLIYAYSEDSGMTAHQNAPADVRFGVWVAWYQAAGYGKTMRNQSLIFNEVIGGSAGMGGEQAMGGGGDTTAPQWYSPNQSTTLVGASTTFSTYWTDDVALDSFVFSLDNGIGSFTNISQISGVGGVANWSNFTTTINSTVNSTIRWQIWANDTSGNMNATPIVVFQTTGTGGGAGVSRYPHIDLGEGLGLTMLVIFKGSAQVIAQTTNQALAKDLDVLGLLVAAMVFVGICVFVLWQQKEIKGLIKK